MKKRLGAFATAVMFIAILALPTKLAAQQPRYRLVDLGTLGGPHGYGSVNGDGFSLLNNSGVVAFSADLAQPDPNSSFFCFNPDCFQTHATRWKDGFLKDLGALPGNNNSAAGSINASGWITGQSQSSVIDPLAGFPEFRAVLWKNGKIQDLGTLPGGTESLGIYVNDSGQVVGFSDNGIPDPFSSVFFFTTTQIHTFLWTDGHMQDVGTLGGTNTIPSAPCSNPPRDVVVGASFLSTNPNAATGIPTLDPYLWKKGVMTDLGTLGGTFGFAQCVNHQGQVIGSSNVSGDLASHAFLWQEGAMADLGTLGGDSSEAIWLNEAGDVVGSADLPNGAHDAVIWKEGKIQDLGTIGEDGCSRGRGLNARGQVVGGSSDCANFLHAFLWEDGGPMMDLNTLIASGSGWQLTNAININDRGEILAKAAPFGFTPNDDADLGHLVLLVPCDGDEDEAGCSGNDQGGNDSRFGSHGNKTNTNPHWAPKRPQTAQENVAALRAKLARRFNLPGRNMR